MALRPTLTESTDGTSVAAYEPIVDAEGSVWGLAPFLSDGMAVFRNGQPADFSANVQELVYAHHLVYQRNDQGNWWVWQDTNWMPADPPSGGPPDGGIKPPEPPNGGGGKPPNGGNFVATLDPPSGRDDTDAINATLENAGPGTVHAPGGHEWLHSGIITVPAGVTLQGDGDSSVFHSTATGSDPDMAIALEGDDAGLVNVMLITDYPTGQGMNPGDDTGDGNRSSQPYAHLVYIPGRVNGFTVAGVHGIGGAAGGIYSGGAKGGNIRDCIIEYALADGIGLYEGTSDTTVSGCTVRGCGDDGIAIVPYDNTGQGGGITIENNTVSGGYWGRGITDVGSKDAIIKNNNISDYYASGMEADHDTGAGTTAPSGGLWEGNTVSNCPNRASGYSGAFFVFRDCSNYILRNNKAINLPAGAEPCLVDGSSDVTQEGNSWN